MRRSLVFRATTKPLPCSGCRTAARGHASATLTVETYGTAAQSAAASLSLDARSGAATWVSSKWAGRAPEGHVLLRAYLGGAHDPQAVNQDDDSLLDTAVRELSAILSITGSPELARVYRWPNAGAQHEVGHLARMASLDKRLAALPGLYVTGSGFRSIGIPDCVADGRRVAGQVAASVK